MVAVGKGDDAILNVGVHDVGAADKGGNKEIFWALVDIAGSANVLRITPSFITAIRSLMAMASS